MVKLSKDKVKPHGALVPVIFSREKGVHAVMGVNICIADISLLIIVRAVVEVGLNLFFTYALLGNIGKKTFFCLIPIDLRHRFIFLALRHKGAEKRNDLAHELCGDLRQSWDKPSPDLRKIHYVVFGGDELALLHFAKLVDPAVAGGDQADDLIRFPRLLQGAESALVGGVALGLHLHLGLNIAAGVLLFRFFECFQKFTGTLDGLLHGNDRGTLGVLDLLANTAVFHAPGNALALLQIGEVLRFADTKLFKGHRGVLDVLLHALVIEDRRLFQKPLLGILRRFLLKSRGNGVSCGCI